MLDELVFKFGEAPGAAPLCIRPGAMTVLVGPNNSGKSLTLREIKRFVGQSEGSWPPNDEFAIVAAIRPKLPQPGELRDRVLENVAQDIAPFHRSLLATGLTPRAVIEKFELSHIKGIIDELNRLGHLKKLAEDRKIDPTLLEIFDKEELIQQPSLVEAIVKFLKQLTQYLERNQATLERIATGSRSSPELALVENGVVRLAGYLHHYEDFTVLLDGRGRLKLTIPQPVSNLQEEPTNMMMRLFHSPDDMQILRTLVFEAFEKHLALDLTGMKKCKFVLSNTPPEGRERSFGTDEALEYFAKAAGVSESSDGVKSYIGLHATLLSRDYRIILVDEPEAFLHPPLARRLGFNLTMLAAQRGASVVAATHSPYFLMGCIEAQQGVNIVRIGYRDGVPTARALPAEELRKMMNDPLLRSTGVLSALFHPAAVVCEGGSDRAFYEEINERLRKKESDAADDAGSQLEYIDGCLFIDAHSKQSVPKLLGALRRMGIPAAGIVDLDVLKDNGVAGSLARKAGAGTAACDTINRFRSQVYRLFEEEAKRTAAKEEGGENLKKRISDFIKKGGIDNLPATKDKNDLRHFIDDLARYGVFVLERGELERWLPELSNGLAKEGWLPIMFEKMGSLNDPSKYEHPGDGDVWEFVRKIASWVDENAINPPREDFAVDISKTEPAAQMSMGVPATGK